MARVRRYLVGNSPAALEIGPLLGRGGMGSVHLAHQPMLGRHVAIKTLRSNTGDEHLAARLVQEAWATGQVCNAVHFAHSRSILHRDLKPDNVRIGAFGEVYVLDWGLAASLSEDNDQLQPVSEIAAIAGTPCYMAPEMLLIEGQPPLSVQTDVYLLGGILHQILTGKPPHEGRCTDDVAAEIFLDRRVAPAAAPTKLGALCVAALARDPRDRPESAEAFRLAIQDYLEHRESADLMTQTDEQFRALTDATSEEQPDLLSIHDLYGAVRFGYHQVLRSWPENRSARNALRRAATTMVFLALDLDDARAAERFLAEVHEPDTALEQRVAAALAADRSRRDAMAAHERDTDLSGGLRHRTLLSISVGALFSVVPIFAPAIEASIMGAPGHYHEVTLSTALAFLIGATVARSLGRQRLPHTRANRMVLDTLVITAFAQIMLEVGTWISGTDALVSLTLQFLLWFCVAMMLALTVSRRFAPGALAYLLGYLVASARPDWVFFPVMSLANLAMLASGLWAFAPRRAADA